jgi:tellurite resistance protein TerC
VHVSAAAWVVTVLGIVGVLLADLVVVSRRANRPTTRQATLTVCVYVALALLFGVFVSAHWGSPYGGQFYAGWLTEYSLSLDNLFVFVVIMTRFAVPAAAQQTVLLVGVLLALLFRGVFIAAGSVAIAQFSWVFYFFGAFLVWTAVNLARQSAGGAGGAGGPSAGAGGHEFKENLLLRLVSRVVPTSQTYDGVRLRTTIDGRRLFTPLLVVMVAIGSTDVLFALDSIPAIFGLTKEPYLVFAANAFALMGLTQLYFLLDGLLDRLVYLGRGLAVILGFIGIKMVFEALAANELPFVNGGEPVTWAPVISTPASLAVIFGVLTVTTVASLTSRARPTR